jgi:hypothetical protein
MVISHITHRMPSQGLVLFCAMFMMFIFHLSLPTEISRTLDATNQMFSNNGFKFDDASQTWKAGLWHFQMRKSTFLSYVFSFSIWTFEHGIIAGASSPGHFSLYNGNVVNNSEKFVDELRMRVCFRVQRFTHCEGVPELVDVEFITPLFNTGLEEYIHAAPLPSNCTQKVEIRFPDGNSKIFTRS